MVFKYRGISHQNAIKQFKSTYTTNYQTIDWLSSNSSALFESMPVFPIVKLILRYTIPIKIIKQIHLISNGLYGSLGKNIIPVGGECRSCSDTMEAEMDKQVLVAYATKYSATAEIAEKIGQVLGRAGLSTDVMPAKEVSYLTPYRAVVLGSAVYIGKWRKEAVKFLQDNENMLAERLVWLFSSGPSGEGDAVELLQGWRFPAKQQPVADRIQAQDIAVFHGAVDTEKLSFIEKSMINSVKAPVGDFRDWDAITAWATTIADQLKEADSAPRTPPEE